MAFLLQLFDGARSNLGMNAVYELLLHLWREHWRAENIPPCCHRPSELLEEVLDATRAAGTEPCLLAFTLTL